MKIYKFDTKKYDFRSIFEDFFETKKLEDIYDPDLKFENPFDCLDTKYHQIYASKILPDKKFLILYNKFIKEYISKLFDFDILFQAEPYLRIHQKNNISVFDYHIDSTYLHSIPNEVYDICKQEINFWMPLTKAYGTNSLWIESLPGKKDYSAITLEYGEIIQFDGANLYHGTEVNKTNQTRVSFDFRVLPKKVLIENKNNLSKLSKNAIKNLLSDYYDEIPPFQFKYE